MSTCQMGRVTVASVLIVLCAGIWQEQAQSMTPGQLGVKANAKQNTTYQEFRSFLMNAVATPNYRVSYQAEMPDNPTTVIQQWFKGDKFRMDTEVEGTSARIYRLGEQVTNCVARGSNWTCFQLPNLQQVPAPAVQGIQTLEEIEENPESYQNQITKIGTRVVAGEPTTCFQIKEPEEKDSLVSCYSNNHGIPLYMEGETPEGTWQMTATDFQNSVSDSAFSLPAPPQTIPSMPGGF